MKYYYKKNFYNHEEVKYIEIIFDNGEYIFFRKSEIIDFQFNFYDKMVWHDNTAIPVAKSGFIKLNISKKPHHYTSLTIDVNEEYKNDRKM